MRRAASGRLIGALALGLLAVAFIAAGAARAAPKPVGPAAPSRP